MKGRRQVQRSYSPEEKAEALRQLALNEGNLSKTVKETGVPIANLYRWKNEQLRESAAPQAKEIEKFIQNSWKNILTLSKPAYIKRFKAPLLEKGDLKGIFTSLAILVDKIILLTRMQALISAGTEPGGLGHKFKEIGKVTDEELQRLIAAEEEKEEKQKN